MAKVLRLAASVMPLSFLSCLNRGAVGRFRNRDFLGCRTEFAPYSRWVQSAFKMRVAMRFSFSMCALRNWR